MVSYSPVYVSRTFKQCFGNNISTYLAERRMQEACALLVSTEWRVADIARSVGYTNYLNFAKRFKQIKEMAPNSFRKKYQL
jgi:AraC-like DNA-binding protein